MSRSVEVYVVFVMCMYIRSP